ncbi:MAG: hypothetical protein ACM3JJ_03150 [Hyphomicrobiales bacterium]
MSGRRCPGRALRLAVRRAPRLAPLLLAASVLGAAPSDTPVRAMLRPVLDAAESVARVTLERSDPFGGPPSRERGRAWYLPGRGLRYRSLEPGGQDVVIDRRADAFLLYSPREAVLYRGAFARAPERLRRLIAEPERALTGDLEPAPERAVAMGGARDGFRVGGTTKDASGRAVTLWLAADPRSGLPRWVRLASETDTLWAEFTDWKFERSARDRDLKVGAPKGTREEPLDPRELLEDAEPGAKGESR